MRCGGKSAHVVADFSRNNACSKFANSRNGGQQLDGDAKGLDAFVHFAIDLGNSGVDGVDLLKMQPQQKAVVLHDPAAQRLAQSSRRRLDAIISERSQLAGISFARDQSRQHRAAGHADDVGNH